MYNGVDYFYGGTAICYRDLWTKTPNSSVVYDDDCQLPKSFSYLPYQPHFQDILPEQGDDNIDTNLTSTIITTNTIGNHLKR